MAATMRPNIARSEVVRLRLGMTEADWQSLTAVIAHWNAYGEPVTLPALRAFLAKVGAFTPRLTALESRGWIKAVGKVRVAKCSWARCYAPTPRAYSILGLEQRKAA